MKRTRNILTDILLGALLVNLVWYIAYLVIDTNALVDPLQVYASIGEVWKNSMSEHLMASLWRILAGVSIAGIIGLFTALWMTQNRIAGKVIGAFVYFAYPIPKLALLPVVMLLAGLGDLTKIIMIVLIIVFQVIINLRDSIQHIPRESFQTVISLGANRWQTFWHVTLPAVVPDMLTTLRVAIGTAISVLFVTETYGTDRGMGYFIVDAWMRLNYIDMYVGIVILSMTGFVLFLLTDLLEARLSKWKTNY